MKWNKRPKPWSIKLNFVDPLVPVFMSSTTNCQPFCGLLLYFFLYFSALFCTFLLFFILCCICQKALGSCADVGLSSFLRINFSEEESASVTVISLKENNDVKDYIKIAITGRASIFRAVFQQSSSLLNCTFLLQFWKL